jgi:hypothetical protein
VEQLRAIGAVSPALLQALVDFLADGNEWASGRLAREPGWVLDAALRAGSASVFAEPLGVVDTYAVAGLRLGKKTEELLERAAALHKQLDRHAYGAPMIRFSEEEVDQARARGVLIEFERSVPIIVDRGLYRELCKAAIKRAVEELETKAAEREQARKANRSRTVAGDPGRRGPARRATPAARARRAGARRQP